MLLLAPARAQDTSRLRITLLTCTPGDELYSIFGHSALRVTDSTGRTDIVYNYGTFNFDDKNFYIRFARGKLNYFLSLEYFEDFVTQYAYTGRLITEQELLLSPQEKIDLHHALLENAKEENRYYKYDFFFDNCTTRLRDIILRFKNPTPSLPAVMPSGTRFREAIHAYLDNGKQYWSKLGIDILLGMPTDRIMTPSEQQFLPDNLMLALDQSKNIQVVKPRMQLYDLPKMEAQAAFITPMMATSLIFLLFVALTFLKHDRLQQILHRLDGLFFFLTGMLGIVLILMWTATDHSMTKNNLNLLWAIPTHSIAAFYLHSGKKWMNAYLNILMWAMGILILAWFLLPQQMNPALLPLVATILLRAAVIRNQSKWKIK